MKKFILGLLVLFGLGTAISGTSDSDSREATSSSTRVHSTVKKSSSVSSSESSEASSSSESSSSSSSSAVASSVTPNVVNDHGLSGAEQAPLAYTGSKQLVLQSLDSLGRPVDAHIQLRDSDEPGSNTRQGSLTVNPVGWHNYKFNYTASDGRTKTGWLMNRGHLVGYQFSGLMNEPRNLITSTTYLNTGAYAGMDDGNDNGMLYFENRLDSWVALHPSYHLDYQVTPLYSGNELVPRQVRLAYVGYDSNGQKIQIKLGSAKESEGNDGATVVYLDNASPNATLNYANGYATVQDAQATATSQTQAPAAASSEPAATAPATNTNNDSNRTVYVTGGGSSDVYWYGMDSMPWNTNKNNIVTMTEAEAIAQGKRHSQRE